MAQKEKKVRVSTYIAESQALELQKIADREERSRNWIAGKAIEEGLNTLRMANALKESKE